MCCNKVPLRNKIVCMSVRRGEPLIGRHSCLCLSVHHSNSADNIDSLYRKTMEAPEWRLLSYFTTLKRKIHLLSVSKLICDFISIWFQPAYHRFFFVFFSYRTKCIHSRLLVMVLLSHLKKAYYASFSFSSVCYIGYCKSWKVIKAQGPDQRKLLSPAEKNIFWIWCDMLLKRS